MTPSDASVALRLAAVHTRMAELRQRFATPAATPGTATFDRALATAMGAPPADGAAATTTVDPVAATRGLGDADAGRRAVALARQQLGTPYVWGAETPGVGFDCSGLVQHTFARLGVDLPRVSRDQAQAGRPVASLAEARPGDLVAFGSPVDHIGIYAGGGRMVVAPRRGDVVKVQQISRTPTAIRRVV